MRSLSQEERDYLTGLLGEQEAPRKRKHGCLWHLGNAAAIVFISIVAIGFAITIAIQFGWVPPLWFGPGLNAQQVTPTFTARPTKPPPFGGGGGGGGGGGAQLPNCATVADTTTACQGQPRAQEATPAATPTPALPWCEDVPAGAGITPCQWKDADAARQQANATATQTVQLWVNMADQAIEEDLRAPASTPTAEVPTECDNPPNERARASCELIKRGILHPKG